MTILIENAETLEYLTQSGGWSNNPAKGRGFATTTSAFRMARSEPIHKFNIVFYLALTRQFVNLDHGRGKGAVSVPV